MAAALCAAALLLSACSDDPPEPKPLDPPTESESTPTAEPSDSPVEPTMPAAAKKLDEAGAKAFVRYYFQALTYAMQTGDTGPVQELGTKACKTCETYVANISKVYDDGGSYQTDGWKPELITPGPRHTAEQPDFLIRLRESPGKTLDEDGNVVGEDKAFLRPMRIVLTRPESAWLVLGVFKIR